MKFIWTKDLAVGVKVIDIQHRVLFKKVNDLMEVVEGAGGAEEIERMFEFLEDYVGSHFAMEQKTMGIYRYPELEFHTAQHRIFNATIDELKVRCKDSGVNDALVGDLEERLCEWLINHVSVVDKALGVFLKPLTEQ